MSRYPIAQATQTRPTSSPSPTFEGDSAFIGLNMATERGALQPGYYPRAINKRVTDGSARKRPGSFPPAFANAVEFSSILGSGIYSNPNGIALQLIATPTEVWKISDGGIPVPVPIPDGVSLSGPVEFSQHFEKVLLHQAAGATLVWNGSAAEGFKVRTKKDPGDHETALVPDSPWSVHFAEREIFPFFATANSPTGDPDMATDTFGVSLVGDITSWDALLGKFRANSGTADKLTGVFPFGQATLIVGKKQSMDVFVNFSGNLAGLAARPFAGIGVWARRTWQLDDQARALFLSGQGVYVLSYADETRLQVTRVAEYRDGTRTIDPLAPFWKRVNWLAAATTAVAGREGPHYILALPIDGSSVNNCLAILNLVSNTWEAIDTWDPRCQMQVDNLLQFNYQGEPRLYAVNHRTRSIHLLHQGKFDDMPNGRHEIADVFETRGYAELGWNGALTKHFKRVEIPLSTWRPSIRLEEITERSGDVRPLLLGPLTKNPAKFQVFGKADYDLTNAKDDAIEPGREDYSVTLAEGQPLNFGQNGIDLEQQQRHPFRASLKCRGRYLSFRISSTQGDCDVHAVLVESAGVQRMPRRAA